MTVPSASVAETAAVRRSALEHGERRRARDDDGCVAACDRVRAEPVEGVGARTRPTRRPGRTRPSRSVSPATIVGLRRSVLSAVLVTPVPHSVPGSTPIWPITSSTVVPLRSTTASSPLNQPDAVRLVGDRRGSSRSRSPAATTNTSPSATVPVRLIVRLGGRVAVEEHLDAVTAGGEIDRRARAVEDLERLVVAELPRRTRRRRGRTTRRRPRTRRRARRRARPRRGRGYVAWMISPVSLSKRLRGSYAGSRPCRRARPRAATRR